MATSLHPSNAFNHRFTPTSYKHRNLNFYRRFPSSFSGRFRVLTYRGSGHGGCSSSSLSKRVMLIIRRLRRLLFNKRKRTTTNVLLLISISLSFLLVSLSKPIPAPLKMYGSGRLMLQVVRLCISQSYVRYMMDNCL
ncbi:hypothetical protein Peur_042043 [Populus x canadensis]